MAVEIVVGANSYVSVSGADTYFNERLYSSAWTAASADDKARALISATKAIDRQFLKGRKKLTIQILQFPRCYQRSVNNHLNYIGNVELVWDGSLWCENEVPQAVKDTQCEEAIALLDRGNSKRRKLQQEGVRSIGIGSTSETYNPGSGRGLISQEAKELLRPYLAGSAVIT